MFVAPELIDLVMSQLVDSDILPARPPLGFGMDGLYFVLFQLLLMAKILLSMSWMILFLLSWEIFFMAAPEFEPVTFSLGINLITH